MRGVYMCSLQNLTGQVSGTLVAKEYSHYY